MTVVLGAAMVDVEVDGAGGEEADEVVFVDQEAEARSPLKASRREKLTDALGVAPPSPALSGDQTVGKLAIDVEAQGPKAGAEEEVTKATMWEIGYRLRFLIMLLWLTILQFGAVGPSIVYISTTFFAGPGSDCEHNPDSSRCKAGAADLAFWKGISQGVSQSIAWLFALTLGSFSDSVGRLPLFRAKAALALLPVAALAVHEFFDWSLWGYLLLVVVYNAFDTNGVFLAFMSDVISEPHLRASAYAALIVAIVVGCGPVLLISLIPPKAAVVVAIAASGSKMFYVSTIFPETNKFHKTEQRRKFSCKETAKEAVSVFFRHSFILRMALVLVLSGLSAAGLGTVITPIMTGYLGVSKGEGIGVALVTGIVALLTMVALLKPLTRRIGEVQALRVCLVASVLYPILLVFCTESWHLALLSALLAGPMVMQFPIISAIKSNLVGDDEQGLVQGALAAVRVGASAISEIFFGWFFRQTTDRGEAPHSAIAMPLGLISALAAGALLIACTLPMQPPPAPPPRSGIAQHSGSDTSPAKQ